MSDTELDSEFMKSFSGGAAANLVFVLLFIIKRCLDKKVKHSECSNICCSCETDMENTQRGNINPYHGERSRSEEVKGEHIV